MMVRAGLGRSVAPTMATERGLTRASSSMSGPLTEEQGDEDAEEYCAGEQRRDHRDDRIGFEPDRFEHLLRERRGVAAGNEDRHHGLVEGMQKGEQRPHQNARPQH